MGFSLPAQVEALRGETTWNTGPNARTLIKYGDVRVVLTALKAGARIPEHRTAGRVSIHALSGQIQVKASGRTFRLRPGGLLALDRRRAARGRGAGRERVPPHDRPAREVTHGGAAG